MINISEIKTNFLKKKKKIAINDGFSRFYGKPKLQKNIQQTKIFFNHLGKIFFNLSSSKFIFQLS